MCQEILDKMVSSGWAKAYGTYREAATAAGCKNIVINKIGLVSKVRVDGTWKYRIVWDM